MYVVKNEETGKCTVTNVAPNDEMYVETTMHFDFAETHLVCSMCWEEFISMAEKLFKDSPTGNHFFKKIYN